MTTVWADWCLKALTTVGFPIAVAAWMLYRDWKLIKAFTLSLETLKDAVVALTRAVEGPERGAP